MCTGAAEEANEALLEENKRLRQQADDLRVGDNSKWWTSFLKTYVPFCVLNCGSFLLQDQLRLNNKGSDSDTDKLELYQALEKAEARIQSLERQVCYFCHVQAANNDVCM